MEIELQIDGGKYPISIEFVVGIDSTITYRSEYKGATISTFQNHKKYDGASIEDSLLAIAKDLRKAIKELLEF